MHHPGIQGTENNGRHCTQIIILAHTPCLSVLWNPVWLISAAGLWHPPGTGRHGCSSLHRLDRPGRDRSASHQPVSVICACRHPLPGVFEALWTVKAHQVMLSVLLQFPFGSLRCSTMVSSEDELQRENFYDTRYQSHLSLAAIRLCESQVGAWFFFCTVFILSITKQSRDPKITKHSSSSELKYANAKLKQYHRWVHLVSKLFDLQNLFMQKCFNCKAGFIWNSKDVKIIHLLICSTN